MSVLTERLQASSDRTPLYDLDPDIFDDVPVSTLREARARVAVRTRVFPRGPWDARGAVDGTSAGLLVLDGLVLRTVRACGRRSAELLGRGDVLRPWEDDGELASVPADVTWRVLDRSRVGVLDGRFLAEAAPWPEVVSALLGRSVRRAHSLALLRTIADLRRVEERVLAAMWHFADRWGAVGVDGVVLPLSCTHEVLASVVCAQRPSVTAALRRLEDDGRLRRLPERRWLLIGTPPGCAESDTSGPA